MKTIKEFIHTLTHPHEEAEQYLLEKAKENKERFSQLVDDYHHTPEQQQLIAQIKKDYERLVTLKQPDKVFVFLADEINKQMNQLSDSIEKSE